MIKVIRFLIMVVVLASSLASVQADDSQSVFDLKRSEESAATVKARAELILAEAAALSAEGNNHWAGAYYFGDGMGVNVTMSIAPEAGFVFEWHGCMGLYDRNWGTVDVRPDGALTLDFALPNEQVGFQGLASQLNVVRWGGRMYLIPPDNMIRFCNSINQYDEPRDWRHGFHLLREGDWEKPVEGWPDVPLEYKDYLLAEPIEAELIHADAPTTRPGLGEITFRDTPITLNAGAAAGLRPGMDLYTTNLLYFYTAKISEVSERSCRAVVTQSWGAQFKPEYYPMPEPGHQFSTLPTFKRSRAAKKTDGD